MPRSKGIAGVQDFVPYHVEGDHIAERDVANLVALNEMLIDQDRAASSWQTQYEWPLSGRLEGFDAFCVRPLASFMPAQGRRVMHQ
jgi:hypothetical protein